jgi:hypothetical protein
MGDPSYKKRQEEGGYGGKQTIISNASYEEKREPKEEGSKQWSIGDDPN